MAQIVIRKISEAAISAFRHRAALRGSSLEAELRQLIERHAPLTPGERLALVRRLRQEAEGNGA